MSAVGQKQTYAVQHRMSAANSDIASRPLSAMSTTRMQISTTSMEITCDYAPIASGENADRKREIAFTCDPFMFFSDTLNAVAGVARLSVRGRNKMTNFIDPGLMIEEASVQARLSD